jgi:hypothetical protein
MTFWRQEKKYLRNEFSELIHIQIENEGRGILVCCGFVQLYARGCTADWLLREREACDVLLARDCEIGRGVWNDLRDAHSRVCNRELERCKIVSKRLRLRCDNA